jgi:outer membrane receptor for ferrienterochelin and colicins
VSYRQPLCQRLRVLVVIVFTSISQLPAFAQPQTSVQVVVRSESGPLTDATVVISGGSHLTDAAGSVTAAVAPGRIEITALKEGFVPATTALDLLPGQPRQVIVQLEAAPVVEETIIVSATRTDARLEDQPMRVEVLAREEIEEKMLMTPGDIVMMLNEMGGMRVQVTSPSLGAASVRIQGLEGRYTRFFSDGLPLFGEVGGLGLLQIPPMDLGQVEVIKGVASSLYGAGAMGGVVNLISRRPGGEREREFLLNRSSRGATDAVAWYATPARSGWAFTLLGGGHWQQRADVNDDAWADLPAYSRGIVRPRVFWDDGRGRSVFATVGFTGENRRGGTAANGILPAAGTAYVESLDTRRVDGGFVSRVLLRNTYLLSARAALSQQSHDHQFGTIHERDRHRTAFGEVTLRAAAGRHTLVGGIAVEHDVYRPRDLPQFAYRFLVPGVFVQDDVELVRWLSLSASGRFDHHSDYGGFFSPRVSALLRSGRWHSRLSVGTGFFGPSPLTEEAEAAGLTRLTIPRPLVAEEGRSASIDLTRADGPFSSTVTFFASRIEHAIHVDRTNGLVLTNMPGRATNAGVELLGTLRRSPWSMTGTYTYVRAREFDGSRDRNRSLTPRHSAGVVGMWEQEGTGRAGVELYYTGVQALEENPFRVVSEPYLILGLLAERQFGRYRLFVNGENLTGVRQTRWDPLVRPDRAPDGRWTVDAWAPLEGRTINGGLRLAF